jgi:hypothetical protein
VVSGLVKGWMGPPQRVVSTQGAGQRKGPEGVLSTAVNDALKGCDLVLSSRRPDRGTDKKSGEGPDRGLNRGLDKSLDR